MAVRVAYVLATSPRHLPLTDSLWYQLEANDLADGRGFVDPLLLAIDHHSLPTAAHPPLYPLFLAAGSLMGARSVLAHQIMGCFVGVATVVGVGLVADHLRGPRAGLLAMGLAAVYPPLWVTDGGIMAEGLSALITTVIVLYSFRLAERRGVRDALMLGASVGLAMLTRAEAVLLLPVLVLPLALSGRREGMGRRLLLAGAALMASAVVVGPWVGRNLSTFDRPVTLSTGDGTLLGANCPPAYYGPGIGAWFESCYYTVTPPARGDESDYDVIARRAGLQYATQHLTRAPLVVAARIGRVWEVYAPVQDALADLDDGRPRWADIAGLIAYWLVVPVAVAGAVSLVRRGPRLFPLAAQLVCVSVTAAVVWGAVRFRAPAEGVLVVLAAVALDVGGSRATDHLSVRSGP